MHLHMFVYNQNLRNAETPTFRKEYMCVPPTASATPAYCFTFVTSCAV